MATSGDYERYFLHDGRRYGHILDPTTGWPGRGVLSVTVWAPTGLDADGWATVLFLAGPERGEEILSEEGGLGALWILDPGEGPLDGSDMVVAGDLEGRVEPLIGRR